MASSSAVCRAPATVGAPSRWWDSCVNANTYAKSKNSSMFVTRSPPERSRSNPLISPSVVFGCGLVAGEQLVQPLEHVLVEGQLDRADRIVQVPDRARAGDRPRDALLVQQPGQGHVGRFLAELLAQILVRADPVTIRLDLGLGPARQPTPAFPLLAQHAAEQAAVQRGPRDHADAVLDRRGQHLELNLADQQVIDRLLADQAHET